MLKNLLLSLLAVFLLTVEMTTAHGAPFVPEGQKLEMYTYWFRQSDSNWGCHFYADLGYSLDCTGITIKKKVHFKKRSVHKN